MVADFRLPLEADFTVDELKILPDEYRYELLDGKIYLDERAPLSELAGVALMAALKVGCPLGLRVLPRPDLWPADHMAPAPDIVVVGPGGTQDVVLVVDVVKGQWVFADMLERFRRFDRMAVPLYWVFEVLSTGASLTEFRLAAGGGLVVERCTDEVFTTDDPFPVFVDLPRMSVRWPETFEYIAPRGR